MGDGQSKSARMNAKGGRPEKCLGCEEWLNQRKCGECSSLDLVCTLRLIEVYSHKIAQMAELLPALTDEKARQGSDGIKQGLDDLGMLTDKCRKLFDADAERLAGELDVETTLQEGGQ